MSTVRTPILSQPPIIAWHPQDDPQAKRVLVVDDEETIRLALGKFLRTRGYEVDTAESGMAALRRLEQHRFGLLLCDVRMPGMSGVDVIRRALETDPELAIIMLTAVNDAPTASEALATGAVDYLVKPVELMDIQQAVERALHKRALQREERLREHRIRTEVATRTEEHGREQRLLHEMTVSIVETLINAMEAKDIYLRGHSARVSELAASMANALELDEDTIEHVRMAGRLHDVGMIGIRESVLHKPGALDAAEFEHVKDHVRIGMEILAPLRHLGPALSFIHDHHERFDGTGYPRGLSGESISIGGRILAAADAFDALTSKRAYREPMEPVETVDYLRRAVGTLLDPKVYDALCGVVKRRKSLIFIDDV